MNLVQLVLAHGLLAFLALAGAWTVARPGGRRLGRRDALLLSTCLLVALLVRLAARPFVGDYQAGAALAFSVGEQAHRWEAGASALFRLALLLRPADSHVVSWLNVGFGTALVATVFHLVDRYFEDRAAAFAAAAFVALQPVLVRYSAAGITHVSFTFASLTGLAFLVAWRRQGGRFALAQAAGWLALAANLRYEGLVHGVAAVLLMVGLPGRISRDAWRELAVATGLGGLLLIVPGLHALETLGEAGSTASVFGVVEGFFLNRYSSPVVLALAVLGVGVALRADVRRGTAFLAALAVWSVGGGFVVFECADLSNRYILPSLAGWMAFAGLGFAAAFRALTARVRPRARPGAPTGAPTVGVALVALGVAWVTALPYRGLLDKTWTYALEYDFLAATLPGLPDGCTIVTTDSDDQMRGLRLIGALSRLAGRRHRWLPVDDPEVRAWLSTDEPAELRPVLERCTLFYRAAACFSFEEDFRPGAPASVADWAGPERPACRQVRERFTLEPVATASLPVLPYSCERYLVDPLPVGFFRLRAPEPRPADGGR